jgi:deoxyribodipyrimidine photo-lyase
MRRHNESLFPPTRANALTRLATFVPKAGRDYASGRNTDNGPDGKPHVSQLSPYLRYRLVTEREVVAMVLSRHSSSASEKFVQEVLWRTYWKGWLEMRPAVWDNFLTARDAARASFPNARAIASAESGLTGIEGFDDWAKELVETGYLHNHARMWFASIWIFTLRLPWALGADFFLRHLIDADAASNTLSWRWVAGLQTAGKTYLATADNIARYTNGRFSPKGLATNAVALTEGTIIAPSPLPDPLRFDATQPALLLVTPEDMNPETVIPSSATLRGTLIAAPTDLLWGEASAMFVSDAALDTAERVKTHFRCPATIVPTLDAGSLIAAAQAAKVTQIVTPYAPVGPVADALRGAAPVLKQAGITLTQVRRAWDARFWPHAKKGFFPFKEQIAHGLRDEGLTRGLSRLGSAQTLPLLWPLRQRGIPIMHCHRNRGKTLTMESCDA